MTTRPALRGTLLAIASSIAFGLTTPLVQRLVRAGHGVGPFTTATLLYAGAATIGLVTRSDREAPVRREHAPRLVAVAVFGALIAPALLAWGLANTSGTSGALMLNLEGVFTVALAWMIHREHVGGRVAGAALALLAGGALLVLDRARDASPGSLGVLGLCAVAGAALAWGVDNVVGRPLSALDPSAVVGAKGAIGGVLSLGVAFAFERSELPGVLPAMALVVVGAIGYGVSLRLYLRAQRAIGAGRTASVFASGPFWGAAVAWALGEPATPLVVAGAVLMIAGLVLHLTEHHGHEHVHQPVEHEHAHVHDDGHHDHTHESMPMGEHTHAHRHDRLVHDHAHVPDFHHDHGHAQEHEHEAPTGPGEAVSPRSSDEPDRR